jgi:hypothetical protein
MASAGFELTILGTRGQHANHQTTEAPNRISYIMSRYTVSVHRPCNCVSGSHFSLCGIKVLHLYYGMIYIIYSIVL